MSLPQNFLVAVVLVFAAMVGPLLAESRVRLEIATDERVPVTAQHEWAKALADAGIDDARISSAARQARVGIVEEGTGAQRVYVVTGAINAAGELVLPGGKFRSTQGAAIARWLHELAEKGPPERREKTGEFGMTEKQLAIVRELLSPAVGFSTKGTARNEVIRKIAENSPVAVTLGGELPESEDDKVAEEFSGVSRGTALACLLRPAGLCAVPGAGAKGPELRVVAAKPDLECWPIGWKPEQPSLTVLPALFESFNANLQNVSAATVLDALAKRLKTPILLDHNAMARHGIELEKVSISLPPARNTYDKLLRKVLSKAQLRMELRVDEAGHPLLWVTTMKPVR